MKSTMIRRAGLASAALTLTLGLAACGGSDDSDEPAASEPTTSEESSGADDMGDSDMMGAFGPGCSAIPSEGAGSLDGMAEEPVATAASNNPLLTTLVSAVTEAGLVDTLNSEESLTVFAPTDDAFAEIPQDQLDALLADKEQLTTVLTHHVVAGELGPDEIAGEHETLAGDMITVEGSDEDFTVGDASVICGNVPTANAKVYVIDAVLMP
ncbi:beta-Ig-H3/fasciclin [Aeromicrobium sp. PE09-221]|uniref:fasciclin domain-containing protein n=1 Tax=Aeromicrobium sp. PE09-221 TaxID=1898043 RepID=UPI000B3E9F24|nr:fasciclin domain-containing protein [Aeromicrobium sp. PE09-221]OUZ09974.1 beta-Ig-H3/fasciclin [Aeromicrobium sp. PE09-221]